MKKKIFVICPAFFKTGGTELLHQLVFSLNQNGYESYIVYLYSSSERNINPSFKKYVSNYFTYESVKKEKNVLFVIPETFTFLLKDLPPENVVVWWESVDNYKMKFLNDIHYNGFLVSLYHWIKRNVYLRFLRPSLFPASIAQLRKAKGNLYQSEYARKFLEEKKIARNVFPLSDFLNDNYYSNEARIDFEKKEDIVIYNPKKGKKETTRIIRKFRNITFIPLINMSNNEIISLMSRAKVYIDFGSHPGKDRLPREAAMMHCCVITNLCGSAFFSNDVSIPMKYKFDDYHLNFQKLENTIKACFRNYPSCDKDFDYYRSKICKEKELFLKSLSCFTFFC